MAGFDRTFRTRLSLGLGPSPVDVMLPLQLDGCAGRASLPVPGPPAPLQWNEESEESADRPPVDSVVNTLAGPVASYLAGLLWKPRAGPHFMCPALLSPFGSG